jgi:glycosyltransferase involved in cell wall biosynthesis
MKFSLIIPCYNEAANLPLLLDRCKEVAHRPDVEVILVDNGSTDNSPEILVSLLPQYLGCRSVRVEKNQGYGFGILTGLRAASGDILGWTHADMQTDPQDALRGLNLVEKYGSNSFVKGRRYGRPLGDVAFTVAMSFFETLLLAKPLWDINAQPTMFSRQFFETWNEPPHDFSLDLYAYYQARLTELDVHRFPVLFGERAHGVSHWNVNWAAKRKFIRRTIDFSLQLRKSLKHETDYTSP